MDKVLNPSDGNHAGNRPNIEIHPWEPYMPDGAKVLIMDTAASLEHEFLLSQPNE